MIETQKEEIVNSIISKLKNGKGVHESLSGGSLVHIDRPLPFICIYRYPEGIKKSAHARLIDAQPSYVQIQQEDDHQVRVLLEEIAYIMRKRFGAFMLLEVWATSDVGASKEIGANHLFGIYCSHKDCKPSMMTLEKELDNIPVVQRFPSAYVKVHEEVFSEERPVLISKEAAETQGVQYLGLEVDPFYYDQAQNSLYPMLFRAFRKQFTIALKKTFFDFIRLQTRHKVPHFNVLGRQREDKLVWQIDQELVEINNSFDFLLLVTPTNHIEMWEEFQRGDFNHHPTFQYRLINVDPEQLKRKLYNIPIEKVDDPTLAYLFRDKRDELDRMLNMLIERETSHFKYSSIQVFGAVEDELYSIARRLLEEYPAPVRKKKTPKEEEITAEGFAELARQEIDFLREQYPELDATVQIRKDIEGLMVSKGQLLIDHTYCTRKSRADALIQHEVGTHVLTFYNGKAQPLQQLYLGSPGYEDLQEGLAVLAEYLVGGLSIGRLRVLAARVIATHSMLQGAGFVEVFRQLHKEYGFTAESAFSLVTRVFRGGGFTKDAVYLKGLVDLLKYLSSGKDLEPLLIGKIRQDYIPFIDELISRKILKPAPLRPRYLSQEASIEKLERLKKGATVFDLIES